jgi:hypothetical protein
MNHERMTLRLAVCFMTVVALMTANGLTGTTTVYAAHSKHSSNQTSSSSRGSQDNNSPSSSTSGSGASGSTDSSGTGSTSNPPPSSGTGTPTGSSGTGTGTKTAPTITPPTTTKKTTGNNPCLTSMPPTSCSSTGTSGSSGNQSQNNHKEPHHTGGGLGSSPNAYKPKDYKHYDTGLGTRHQNSSRGTPSGPGTGSNRTHDSPYGPKTGDKGPCVDSHFNAYGRGCGEHNANGPCVDSHFNAYGRGCGEGTHCIFIEGHGLFCRHGFVGGESHGMKHEGDTKVMHETEIKVTREPSSVPYDGPSSVALLSPTSNDFVNNDPTTISVDHVTITSNGEQWWIKGTVTNNSNQTMHGLRVTGTWYDSGNTTMGMSSGFVSGLSLNPGQHGTFSQFANYNIGRTPSTVELSYDWQ